MEEELPTCKGLLKVWRAETCVEFHIATEAVNPKVFSCALNRGPNSECLLLMFPMSYVLPQYARILMIASGAAIYYIFKT